MKRNPNFRGEPYPCEGSAEDKAAGYLADCGKTMPFIDTIVTTIVKEKVPRKEMFKQGYLDVPEIERPEWGVDFRVDIEDSDRIKALYESRGFQFPLTTDVNNWYLGFNWLDPVVGKGDTPEQQVRNRKLRHALSIAIDWEEGYGRIFRNKGGDAAHGPVPSGAFGSREGQPGGHNPVTHKVVSGQVVRRSIDDAKQLLAEAGYPNGRDAKSGRPLVLNYDYQRTATPEIKAELDWMVKQFAKIGVQLEVRATDYNQFQEKVLKGKHQIFWWGWLGDYPDAENFLFLLYGPNSKSLHEGENAANYDNPEYDKLYRRLQTLDDGPEKQKVVDEMVRIAREDAPWAWGYWPYVAIANQSWVSQRQARHHGARHGALLPRRCRRCARASRPNGTSRCGGRSCCSACSRWRWASVRCAVSRRVSAPPRGRPRPRHEGRSMLNYAIRRIGYGLLILLGVNLLTFFLFFTVNTPDDMARLNIGGKRVTQEQIDKWKAERGYDKPKYWNDKEAGGESVTNTIFWERSVSLFKLDFGRSDATAP